MAQCYRNSGSLKNGMAAQAHRTSGSFAPRLFIILMGLHNLPRIYSDGEGEIDDLKKWLISQEEAFAYSSSYLAALIESQIKKNLLY